MAKGQTPNRMSPRTEAFALRFDPTLKYMAELAARRERRSLTNFVEWAIEQALKKVVLRAGNGQPEIVAANCVESLWDIDEAERLRKLQQHCPDLLSYEEQRLLAAIADFAIPGQPPLFKTGTSVDWVSVKAYWPQLKAYAAGKKEGSEQELVNAIRTNKQARKR